MRLHPSALSSTRGTALLSSASTAAGCLLTVLGCNLGQAQGPEGFQCHQLCRDYTYMSHALHRTDLNANIQGKHDFVYTGTSQPWHALPQPVPDTCLLSLTSW